MAEDRRLTVVLLTTYARVGPTWVARRREKLGDLPVRLVVVSLHPPRKRLKVHRTVVVGPSVRPRRRPRPDEADRGRRVAWRTRSARLADRVVGAFVPSRIRNDPAVQLATGVSRSREVLDLCRTADAVVATDAASAWAAWQIAQRIPDPLLVVSGIDALHAALTEREHRQDA